MQHARHPAIHWPLWRVLALLVLTSPAWSGKILQSPEEPAAVHMATGVKIGEVTTNSALIWTRLTRNPGRLTGGVSFPNVGPKDPPLPEGARLSEMDGAAPGIAGAVRLKHWQEGQPAQAIMSAWSSVEASADFTHTFKLEGLEPGRNYLFRVEGRGLGATAPGCKIEGAFGCVPAADQTAPVRFCVVTGEAYQRRDDPDRGHRIYSHMLALEPDFFVHTGDAVYYDKPKPWARTRELARLKWNRKDALPFQREFHRFIPGYLLKDDHDTLRNDCWPTQSYGSLSWEDGLELFAEQNPVGNEPYRSVRWGKDLELWFVEGREFRSPNNQPDGPDKTIWGAAQKRWLFDSLQASDAMFKVVVSPTPIVGPDRTNKKDNHANAGFAHEGREVREFLAELENVIVICGDRHWQYVSIDPETGLREFSCGPTNDKHAGGFRKSDRSDMHRYLNVVGGFLVVELVGGQDAPELRLSHRDTQGAALHEETVQPSR